MSFSQNWYNFKVCVPTCWVVKQSFGGHLWGPMLEKFPEKFCSLCLDALKHNPVYFVPLFGQDVILLFFFFFFRSERSTKNNILVRSSLTQVSLFALWPPHLIPGGAGCFFGIPVAPDGCLSLLCKKGRSHYCRHFFFLLTVRTFFFSSSLRGLLYHKIAAFPSSLRSVQRLSQDHIWHFHMFFNNLKLKTNVLR